MLCVYLATRIVDILRLNNVQLSSESHSYNLSYAELQNKITYSCFKFNED